MDFFTIGKLVRFSLGFTIERGRIFSFFFLMLLYLIPLYFSKPFPIHGYTCINTSPFSMHLFLISFFHPSPSFSLPLSLSLSLTLFFLSLYFSLYVPFNFDALYSSFLSFNRCSSTIKIQLDKEKKYKLKILKSTKLKIKNPRN